MELTEEEQRLVTEIEVSISENHKRLLSTIDRILEGLAMRYTMKRIRRRTKNGKNRMYFKRS